MTQPNQHRTVVNQAVLNAEAETAASAEMTGADRGRLIMAVCAAAAAIDRGRKQSSLPDPSPAPWPASTWEFQKKWTAGVR